MASTGFAGGLAEGLNGAIQLSLQKRYYDGLNDNRDRANDIRQQTLDAKEAAGTSTTKGKGGGDYEGFDNSLIPIFKSGKPAAQPQQAQVPTAAAGLAGPTVLQNDALQAGGLGAAPPPAQAPAPAEEAVSPRQQIVKEMMFGNLANEPDKLNAIAAAAAMHGLGDKITPWIEGLYKAKRSGIFDGAMSLINNNVDGAIDHLERGGIKLEDRPVKVNPDDPNDHQWKINISGTGERVMDVRNMVASTMDADKFSEFQNKSKVASAQADAHTANAEESRAKAKSYESGGLGSSRSKNAPGGPGKAPRVVKTVETDQGMAVVMSDGTQKVLKGENGKPMFGPSAQKVAAGLVGKTLDPSSDGNDIASRVNTMTDQLRGEPKNAPARLNDIPEGAKLIGTSKGKPVYEVNGKRWVGE